MNGATPGGTVPGMTNDMSGMGMEHALDTLYVPPLVDDRVFSRFARAVRDHAASLFEADEAEAKLRELRDTLQNLRNVASMCRLAARGDPRAFCRAHDELNCIAIDFPGPPLDPGDPGMPVAAPDTRAQLAAALDLFAGAAFVSKGDAGQLARYVTGVVRAIEMAAAFPLAFADEAACYVGEGDGAMAPSLARLAIANATQRLLANDTDCTPSAPAQFRARLETLAQRWIKANPVTALFDALTGTALDASLVRLRPNAARAGQVVALTPGTQLLDADSLVAMCCPHVPARIVRSGRGEATLSMEVPDRARSGPVAIVQRGGADQFAQVKLLLQRYQADFEAEWMLGVFSFIPLPEWCYPVAFTDSAWLEVAQTPRAATAAVFDEAGRRAESRAVRVGEPVTVTYAVDPAGSDAEVAVSVTATNGTITPLAKARTYLYRPTSRGTGEIRFAWGSLSVVARVTAGG
jgi:hypothetical protein